jgi:hypothetical protein
MRFGIELKERRSKNCEACDLNEDETVVHIRVECTRYEIERDRLLRILETEVGGVEMNKWFAREASPTGG